MVKHQTKNIQSEQYLRAHHQVVVSTFSFILYSLFILIPRYFRQLHSYLCSIFLDTDAVSAILIACLFRRLGHRCRRRQSCIQYSGVWPLSLSEVVNKQGKPLCYYRGNSIEVFLRLNKSMLQCNFVNKQVKPLCYYSGNSIEVLLAY